MYELCMNHTRYWRVRKILAGDAHQEKLRCPKADAAGGSVWESNPPFGPRRTESTALKAVKVTGPFSPPFKNLSHGETYLMQESLQLHLGQNAGRSQPSQLLLTSYSLEVGVLQTRFLFAVAFQKSVEEMKSSCGTSCGNFHGLEKNK
jgi:hypothetical protein